MILKWGFTVPGGLVDRLLKEYALHEATIHYTLNDGIKANLTDKNAEIIRKLDVLGVKHV